ncbi:sugar-binding transcriptional regulator [Deinococcus roseus]|nr:sugar-binding domain-containing protein [Deinococcus roseus]
MPSTDALAVQVARLYYHQNLTTEKIAAELGLSRPKVSRLLTHARKTGLVEIRIHDPQESSRSLESLLTEHFQLDRVHVVLTPENATEAECMQRVAVYAAHHAATLIQPGMTVGLAWGTTLNLLSQHLQPRPTPGVKLVQLNGSGNPSNFISDHALGLLQRFGDSFQAALNPFPVPAFFDHPETKTALWKERSIQRVLDLQQKADLLLYSVGSAKASVPSYVHAAPYLDPEDLQEMQNMQVVGDIATVFFREDGSFDGIPLNRRASGPDLGLFKNRKGAVCIVAGVSKALALWGALRGGLMSELIVDDKTVRKVLEFSGVK